MSDFIKFKQASVLSKFMDQTFDNVQRTDPEFGKVLKKWKSLFYNTVKKVSIVGEITEMDVFQEIMISLIRINSLHPIKLYRYKGKVYELSKVDGFYVRLVSCRYTLRQPQVIWVRKERVKRVKKASLSALVYRKIQQQSSVMFRSVFTQKNGYEVVSTENGVVKMRNGEYGEKFKNIEKNKVIKVWDQVSLSTPIYQDEGLTLKDVVRDLKGSTSEEECLNNDIVERMLRRLSKPSQAIFKWMILDANTPDRETQQIFDISKRQLSFAKREILQVYMKLTKQQPKSTYAPYVIFNGNYFYLIDEDGDYMIIGGGLSKHYVHKHRVKIEKEMSYRTPIHIPASMVA